MTHSELTQFFEERFTEIEDYVSFLNEIEEAARFGAPRIETSEVPISASQQKILYSSVYLQLYNLVEATVSRCMESVTKAAADDQKWSLGDLNAALRSEWIRVMARTHTNLSPDHRLESAIAMCLHLLDQLPITEFEIEIGGGGNWDDDSIEKISTRVGCELRISPETRAAAKRPMRDDLGAMKLVKNRRNRLAHGSLSFVECADGVTASELRKITEAVGSYLRETITCFSTYVETLLFLDAKHHVVGAA